ncbi:MAG: hypothetical protein M3540_10230, partial [Actinomycetota bacterium]|nr:hypothetical protein [Actinomycetota bacterium]
AFAQTTKESPPTQPVYDAQGHVIMTPFAPVPQRRRLNEAEIKRRAESIPEIRNWLKRYPTKGRVNEATFKDGVWTYKAWWGEAGQIAQAKIADDTGLATDILTGPQVAWGMARGGPGAFGGEKINSPLVWGAFCALFFFGLADLRRPLSIRNLDLVVLLGFTVSLWYFNRGDIFTAMPLVYPPLVYAILRTAWIGFRGRGSPTRPVWPTWVLVGATVFLIGFRVGLNVETSNVIDVGFAGVVGAQRIVHDHQVPYGHMPAEGDLKPCGPANQDGEIRERIQTNGRCEASNERGDTYGPVSYEAYVPGYLLRGWSGKWDDLPAARYTSILWDLLCIGGLWLLGRRMGGARLAATFAFAWTAYPFTQYVSNSNTNDAIVPAFLIWGLWAASSASSRGAAAALSGWTKFGTLIVAPLWLSYPRLNRAGALRFSAGFAVATVLAFSIFLLEPSPLHALRVFGERTIGWQLGRESPFSLWDWGQYHARGIPDLHRAQQALEGLVILASLAVVFVPRTKSLLQLTALTGMLIAGFELVLTHWFFLYIPWFFPFVAVAMLTPRVEAPPEPEEQERSGSERRELVPAG